jgi:hypothetical protein
MFPKIFFANFAFYGLDTETKPEPKLVQSLNRNQNRNRSLSKFETGTGTETVKNGYGSATLPRGPATILVTHPP